MSIIYAVQLEAGDIHFNKVTNRIPDIKLGHEMFAYKAQYSYDPNSVKDIPTIPYTRIYSYNNITSSWVYNIISNGIRIYGHLHPFYNK